MPIKPTDNGIVLRKFLSSKPRETIKATQVEIAVEIKKNKRILLVPILELGLVFSTTAFFIFIQLLAFISSK